LLLRTRHFSELLIVACLLSLTAPLYAQRQQQDAAKLKADARNVVGTIGADKDKTKTHCQILDLDRRLERAEQEKDRKKAGVLSQKINQLQKQIGPEFVALGNIVEHLDLNSPDGQETASIIQSLNQSCPE
jgi:hypothetical protein